MKQLFREIQENTSALFTLIEVNIKTTVATTRLGWLWWVINPLITMGIYYFFVHVIMDRGGSNYHLFILTGLIAWQTFSAALTGTTKVITSNKQLIRQVALPIAMLTAIPVLVQLFFNSIGIFIILIWNYKAIGWHSLSVILLLILLGLIVYGLGLFLSVLSVYLTDTKQILAYVLRAGFFLSPVLFPASRITESDKLPEIAKIAFQLNPMTWLLTAFREVLLEGHMFSWRRYFIMLSISLVIIQLGLFWQRANASRIIKML